MRLPGPVVITAVLAAPDGRPTAAWTRSVRTDGAVFRPRGEETP